MVMVVFVVLGVNRITVEAANPPNPKMKRTLTVNAGETKELKLSPKNASNVWEIQKVTSSKKKILKVSKVKKALSIKVNPKKPATKPVEVKVYLRLKKSAQKKYAGSKMKVLTCKIRVIPSIPKIPDEMTLKVGETKALNITPKKLVKSDWQLKSITTSSNLVDVSANQKKMDIKISGKEVSQTTVNLQFQMKKKTYKKYKKYVKKIKNLTLKCTINVVSSGTSSDPTPTPTPDPEPDPKPDPEPDSEPDPKPDPEPDPEPDPKPDPEPDPEPDPKPDPIKTDIDVSNIQYFGLMVDYDGKPKYCSYDEATIPEGIESLIFEGDGKTDAGTYPVIVHYTVTDTSKYNVPQSTTLQLTINKVKAKISGLTFDPVTKKIIPLVDGNVTPKVEYTVNGEKCEEFAITKPGWYKVAADIVDPNYEGEAQCSAIFNVKRNQAWYQFRLSAEVVDNDKIEIKVFLQNVNIKFAENYTLLALAFDVDYDPNVLEFETFSAESGWNGSYNPERETEGQDVLMDYYSNDPMPEDTMICRVVYRIVDREKFKNLEFGLKNAIASTGEDDFPFEYMADDEIAILNSENAIPEYSIILDWDLVEDSQYQGYESEKAEYIEVLREYIKEKFKE